MSDVPSDDIPTRARKSTFSEKAASWKIKAKESAGEMKESAKARLTMVGEIKNAVETLNQLAQPDFAIMKNSEKRIPLKILQKATGLAFMTEIKAGFLFSGKAGTGIVIRRLPGGGWSGPSCFGFGGVGAGLMVGASKTNTIVVLNTADACDVFASKGQIKLGADLEITAGPVGRDIGGQARFGSEKKVCKSYSYSHSKGLFGGISIDGTVLVAKTAVNAEFYGSEVTPADILANKVEVPKTEELQELYVLLNRLGKVSADDIASQISGAVSNATGGAKKAAVKSAMGF